jgi:hypothetical protein
VVAGHGVLTENLVNNCFGIGESKRARETCCNPQRWLRFASLAPIRFIASEMETSIPTVSEHQQSKEIMRRARSDGAVRRLQEGL